jgi:predicted NBD/HSP70 family sugar kinase
MINQTGTDKGQLRRQNLKAVLERVHHSRGVTRAELTRTLGLNRSTIGDLVGALSEAGWVDEVDDAPREGAGRPSLRVVPKERWLVAAVNPELDAVDVALVALGGRVVARRRVSVDSPTMNQAVSITASAVAEMTEGRPSSVLLGAGVAVPGLVRRSDGIVRLAPHLGWRESAFAETLSSALGIPVEVANDAHLGCRAESVFGAGIGAASLVYINGGPSGIGGGLIIDSRAVGGRDGYAGEIGHVSVDPDGPTCACGAIGCLEALVRREHLLAALGLKEADDLRLGESLLASTAPEVSALIEQQWGWLRTALRGVVNLLNPERIVLGGHLAIVWNALTDADRDGALDDALNASARGVVVEPAALGPDRLILGAAELAWDRLLADPLSPTNLEAQPVAFIASTNQDFGEA